MPRGDRLRRRQRRLSYAVAIATFLGCRKCPLARNCNNRHPGIVGPEERVATTPVVRSNRNTCVSRLRARPFRCPGLSRRPRPERVRFLINRRHSMDMPAIEYLPALLVFPELGDCSFTRASRFPHLDGSAVLHTSGTRTSRISSTFGCVGPPAQRLSRPVEHHAWFQGGRD